MLVNQFPWQLISATYRAVEREETGDNTYGVRASWVYHPCGSEDEHIFAVMLLLDDDAFEVLKVILEYKAPGGDFLRCFEDARGHRDALSVSVSYRLYKEVGRTHFDLTQAKDDVVANLFYSEAVKYHSHWQPPSGDEIPSTLFELFGTFVEQEDRRISEERAAWWAEYRKNIIYNGRRLGED